VICADSDYDAMERASRVLVEDMRSRIREIPRHLDVLPVSREFPLRLVVLEEWANALTIASIAKGKAKGLDTELGRNVQMLLAEGHKVGFRCLLLMQRMDAALIGSFNRDNISHRISHRTASKDGLKLLHEHIDDITAERHATEDPGIALVQAPGIPLARLRAHTIASYSDYLDRIDTARNAAWNTAA
jgi:S-DNA-T family DNA segregation ATPase FtsK/SpoIIIE